MAKQVEEVLDPRQLELYRNRVFPDLARAMLRRPEFLAAMGATAAQKEQLGKIAKQHEQETQEQEQRYNDQSLAVLSPAQLEKLRASFSAATTRLRGRERL